MALGIVETILLVDYRRHQKRLSSKWLVAAEYAAVGLTILAAVRLHMYRPSCRGRACHAPPRDVEVTAIAWLVTILA